MQALRGAAARLATVQRALPLLPAWALPALPTAGLGSGTLAAACRAGAPRGLFGCAGTLLPPAAGAAFAQRPATAPGTPPFSARGVISVPVDNNNIDKAMRRLKRRLIEEGIVKELKERQHYTKPSQQRVRPRRCLSTLKLSCARAQRRRPPCMPACDMPCECERTGSAARVG